MLNSSLNLTITNNFSCEISFDLKNLRWLAGTYISGAPCILYEFWTICCAYRQLIMNV